MKKITILLFIFISTHLWGQSNLSNPNPIHWNATYEELGNDEYMLQFTADIDKGWYLYGQDYSNSFATKFVFENTDEVIIIGRGDHLEEIGKIIKGHDEDADYSYTKYANKVVFKRKIRVTQEETNIVGHVQYMSCTDSKCLPPTEQSFSMPTIYREEGPLLLGSGIDMAELERNIKKSKKEFTADNILDVLKSEKKPKPVPVPVASTNTKPTKKAKSKPKTSNTSIATTSTPLKKSSPVIQKKPTPLSPVTFNHSISNPISSEAIIGNEPELEVEALQQKVLTQKETKAEKKTTTIPHKKDLSHLPKLRLDHNGDPIPEGSIIHSENEEPAITTPYVIDNYSSYHASETKKSTAVKKKLIPKTNVPTTAVKAAKVTETMEIVEPKRIETTPTENTIVAARVKQIPSRSNKQAKSNIVTPITWEFELVHIVDDVYEIQCLADIEEGWHLYAMNNTPQGNGPYPLNFQFANLTNLNFVDSNFIVNGQTEESYDFVFDKITKRYRQQLSLKRQVKLTANQTIDGAVKFMAANQANYLMPQKKQFSLETTAVKTITNANKASFFQTSQENYKWFIFAGMLLSTLGLGYMVYVYKKNDTQTIG